MEVFLAAHQTNTELSDLSRTLWQASRYWREKSKEVNRLSGQSNHTNYNQREQASYLWGKAT